MLIDYLWPLCLIVELGGKPVKKGKKKSRKKEIAKSRMLNIEVVARGLMKLNIQLNSLLQLPVPHPPPLHCFVPLFHWLIVRSASGLCVRGVDGK